MKDKIKENLQTAFALCVVVAIFAALVIHARPHLIPMPPPQKPLQLLEDAYPLYSGSSWSAPQKTVLEISTTTVVGTEVVAAPVENVSDLGLVFAPFLAYYRNKLINLGWSEDTSLEANGPGSGVVVYRKGLSVIELQYQSVFHTVSQNAPEQCPCDVTLSLFSSEQ